MSHFIVSGYNWIWRWLLYRERCISENIWYILDQAMLEAWQKKLSQTIHIWCPPVKEVKLSEILNVKPFIKERCSGYKKSIIKILCCIIVQNKLRN